MNATFLSYFPVIGTYNDLNDKDICVKLSEEEEGCLNNIDDEDKCIKESNSSVKEILYRSDMYGFYMPTD